MRRVPVRQASSCRSRFAQSSRSPAKIRKTVVLLPMKPGKVERREFEYVRHGYIREHNKEAKPFVWTKPAETILAKLRRLPASIE